MSARSALLALVVAFVARGAWAVSLAPDGAGQALIFPYYTVQASGPDAFNTLISITNGSADAKVMKVRFREGRNSRLVAEFNVYLLPGDVWTGAVVPDGDGAKLISADMSCVDPPFVNQSLSFSNAAFASNDDGAGSGLDRVLEGHFEAIEMGTLNAAGVAALSAGCGSVTPAQVIAPTGGLRGGASLVNVNRGLDVTYNADALADLTTQPFYSAPGQPGTDFDSPQVTPVSNVTAGNVDYHFLWNRGVDAVSSVLMAASLDNDFVLDAATRSHSDWVVTFPTRRFYVTPTSATAPFTSPSVASLSFDQRAACEVVGLVYYDREGAQPTPIGIDFPEPPPGPPPLALCWASGAIPVRHANGGAISDVFASRNQLGGPSPAQPALVVGDFFQDGNITLSFIATSPGLTSLAASARTSHASGQTIVGAVSLKGLPVSGFMARTFENGALQCGSLICQGNYSSGFTHHRMRAFN